MHANPRILLEASISSVEAPLAIGVQRTGFHEMFFLTGFHLGSRAPIFLKVRVKDLALYKCDGQRLESAYERLSNYSDRALFWMNTHM